MKSDLLKQFMLWNGSSAIACCLLQCSETNTFSVIAANPALSEILKNNVSIEALEDFINIKQHINSIIASDGAKEWTAYCDRLNSFYECRCQLIEERVYALWITAAAHKPADVLGDIPIGIIRMKVVSDSENLSCVYSNSTAQTLTGTVGREADDYAPVSKILPVHEADAQAIERLLATFATGDAEQLFECRLCPPDAQTRWIRARVSWVIPQKLLQIAFIDISNEKQTEAHSRQNQLLLQKILDTTQAAIFWKDAARRFIGVNKAFLEYYGFASEQALLGKTDEDMGWHSDPDPYKNDELRVLQGESTTRVPGMCLCKGENRHIVASKSPLLENGEIIGLVGSFEDVTSEVRLRNDVVELNSKLQTTLKKERKANQAKSDFLLRMSHDMRTPLTTIVGFADLELKKHQEPDLVKAFTAIKSCSNYLLAILSDILDLQKLSNGTIDITPSICTGAASAKAIESIIRPQAEAKNITFITHFACASATCHVQIDTLKVQQIIVNLLNNAVKYTQPGGTITWRNVISAENIDSITVTHVISDNGPGISKKFQASMYAPFTQESHAANSGSGLGLSIVKKLVDILGGTISCRSAPGEGTTFTVILPHIKSKDNDITAYYKKDTTQADTTPLAGKKVLVCEDNVINSEILKEILEGEGMSCDLAFNGLEGVTMARNTTYDVILMDIRMPVMDGYEATRTIREFDQDTPIAALSANVFSDEIQNAFECGMDAFLEKPIVVPRLLAALLHLVSTTI